MLPPNIEESPLAVEPAPLPTAPLRTSPGRAWAEILMCSGYPTQIVIGEVLKAAGISPLTADGALSARFVFALSLSDTIVLLTLIVLLLRRNGESPRRVFFGNPRVGPEIAYGIFSVPFVVTLVIGLTLIIRAFAPGLRNVPDNPLEGLLGTQTGLLAFLFVVIVAGGLREELQRAFLLHRFRHDLHSPLMGLLITSLAFGLGHTLQGWDAAILTGALGATWGAMYLARGSAVASIVSHSLFNSGELIRAFFR